MHRSGEFISQYGVDAALTRNAGHSDKGVSDDQNAEMGFAFRPRAGVTRMQMRLVNNIEF